MNYTIPFFYADLIARMVPGAIVLALIQLTPLKSPQSWSDFICGLGNAQVVVTPIIYAGLAYMIGTLLEVLLNPLLEKLYICAFKNVTKAYSWTYTIPAEQSNITGRNAKELCRASFGQLIVSPSDAEKHAVSHLVRFHSEGKMCFSLSFIFVCFIALTIFERLSGLNIIQNIQNGVVWFGIMIFFTIVLLYATYERLKSRARFVLRTIERLAGLEGYETLKKLRDELYIYSENWRKYKRAF